MRELKSFAVEMARNAGALLKKKFNKTHKIQYKGDINIVTEADKMSEHLIIKSIRRNFPEHGILSEESPAIAGAGKNAGLLILWTEPQITHTDILSFAFPLRWKATATSFLALFMTP